MPEHPAGALARSGSPSPSSLQDATLQILEGDEWVPEEITIQNLDERIGEARAVSERRVADDADEYSLLQLKEAKEQLADLMAAARLLEQDVSMAEAQVAALDRRLSVLQEERDRNRDIKTLTRLGSIVAASHIADHNCPTCRQSLDAVEAEELGPTLDLDETIALLNAQISTMQKMRSQSQSGVGQASSALAAMQRKADQLTATVRAFQADVLAPADSPSTGDVAKLVTLQLRYDELTRAQSAIQDKIIELGNVARSIAAIRSEINRLPAGVPESDVAQLSAVVTLMHQRLTESGFYSYSVDQVILDPDSLRPDRSGYDIDVDVSASDVVRIKVAYLDGIRDIGVARGRHPGLLIFDELRQQDISLSDFASILQRLARGQGQTIVFTATPLGEIESAATHAAANIIDLGELRLLQPDDSLDPLDVA